MSLRTFPLALTSTETTVFTVPPNSEGTANNILVTGTGDLTLKYYNKRENSTITVYDTLSITDRFNEEKSFNLEPGDKFIASGTDLNIFISVYFVSSSNDTTLITGPGPQEFVAGGMSAGFFGEVDSSQLFTPVELDLLLGFTEGVPMEDAGWLKFARDGEILYVQKRPMRHSISWKHIYSRGAAYGTNDNGSNPSGTATNQYKPLRKGDFMLTPRLLTGASADPVDNTGYDQTGSCPLDLGGGSEWNDLIYRVHQDIPICGDPEHDEYHGGVQVGDNWFNYGDADLGVVSGAGRATWCQETTTDNSSYRVSRGNGTSVANFRRFSSSLTHSNFGLRLVLALNS